MTPIPTVRLGQVADVFNGKTPSRAEQREAGHPILKIRDVSEIGEFRGSFSSFVDAEVARKFEKKWLVPGDTLILNAAHNADYVGSKTYRAGREVEGAVATGEWLLIRPHPSRLNEGFLHHWINAPRTRKLIREMVKGIHLYPKDVVRLALRLPSLEEQRRIADVLDRADELRAKRRRAIEQLETLKQSIFLDMFGHPVRNEREWDPVPFSSVCESRLGKMVDQKQETGRHAKPYLRNANVQWFGFDLTSVYEMDFHPNERHKFRLKPGDLIICEGGQPGRAAIWVDEIQECYYQKALHRAEVMNDRAVPEYLVWLLWFFVHSGGLRDHVTSATISHLTGVKLKSMRIPLPPVDLQLEFARRLEKVEKVGTALSASLAEQDVLISSLQQRAFSGAL